MPRIGDELEVKQPDVFALFCAFACIDRWHEPDEHELEEIDRMMRQPPEGRDDGEARRL